MAKVDTDKFIALLVETYCRRQGLDRKFVQTYIDDVHALLDALYCFDLSEGLIQV